MFDPDEWSPDDLGPWAQRETGQLEPGQLVVWERQPYRVLEVREVPDANWPEKYRRAWVESGMPDPHTWCYRPRVVVVRHEERREDKPIHLGGNNSVRWYVLPEHYAVCRLCRELPPCTHVHTERVMARASERMAKEMAILPGACHGCREPITRRQKSFTFPGSNLIRPDLGDHSAIFHTRGKCYGALTAYDKRWAAAEPDRARLFFCEGTRTIHYTGDVDCDNPQCLAKGELKDLVDHRCSIWHRPGTPGRLYEAMRDFGHDPGAGNDACWCLAGLSGQQQGRAA